MIKKILLVEDDPFLVDIYTTKIREDNFTIDVATNGFDALEKMKTDSIDLVLLDIVLPQIDGWEILKQVKPIKQEKGFKIIVLSNLSQKEEIRKGLNYGADKYLIKAHYTPSEVIAEMKEILGF